MRLFGKFKSDFAYCILIIIISIFPLGVINEPRLIGKTVLKMRDCKWKYGAQNETYIED